MSYIFSYELQPSDTKKCMWMLQHRTFYITAALNPTTMTSRKKAQGKSRRAAKAQSMMDGSSGSISSSSGSFFDISLPSSRSGILSDGILSDNDNFSRDNDFFSSSSGSISSMNSGSSSSTSSISIDSGSIGSISSSSGSLDDLEEFPIFDINTHRLLNDMNNDMNDLEELLFLRDTTNKRKKDRWNHQRMVWDYHVDQLLHEGLFENEYRMSFKAYDTLSNGN